MHNRNTIFDCSYLNMSPGWCEGGQTPQGPLREEGKTLIAAVVTVMAINMLSICQETMRKGDKDGHEQH